MDGKITLFDAMERSVEMARHDPAGGHAPSGQLVHDVARAFAEETARMFWRTGIALTADQYERLTHTISRHLASEIFDDARAHFGPKD